MSSRVKKGISNAWEKSGRYMPPPKDGEPRNWITPRQAAAEFMRDIMDGAKYNCSRSIKRR